MKFSIITVVFNNEKYIEDAMLSVFNQTYQDVEYIVVDGGSTDKTVEIINKYRGNIDKFISEKDDGLYNALNKGIRIASGDVIGILHSDDIFHNRYVLEKLADVFEKNACDSVYGDLIYVKKDNTQKVSRFWQSGKFKFYKFPLGWMPPHPTFFVKRNIIHNYNIFNENFKIAADYDLILRLLWKNKISTYYIPEILVRMRMGGESNKNIFNIIKKSTEDYHALKNNNMKFPLFTLFAKNISKIPQYFFKNKIVLPNNDYYSPFSFYEDDNVMKESKGKIEIN